MSCLCTHLTDFAAFVSPPKVFALIIIGVVFVAFLSLCFCRRKIRLHLFPSSYVACDWKIEVLSLSELFGMPLEISLPMLIVILVLALLVLLF